MNQQNYTKALNDEYNALKNLMNDTTSGFCRIRVQDDTSAIVEYFNDGLCELLGMTRIEVVEEYGNDPYKSVCTEDLPNVRKALKDMEVNGGRINITFRLCCATGGFVWVMMFGRQSALRCGIL